MRIVLVAGLLEPQVMLWPLRRCLSRHFDEVEIFEDRVVMRDIDDSVKRLRQLIRPRTPHERVGVVTHSFGDWIARQAIALSSEHCVASLVSVTPAMRLGPLTAALHGATGRRTPELRILADPRQAEFNLGLADSIERTVIWAKVDAWIRPIPLDAYPQIRVRDVWATHLGAVLQPEVMRIITNELCKSGD